MKTIAILDGQTIQTLPVAKSLKEKGFYIILFCDNKNSYGYRTRFGDEKILAPSTKNNPKEFHQFFMTHIRNNKIDTIIPMNDYSAQYLSFNKKIINQYCKVLIPDYTIFMAGYDKNRLMKLCSENGFAHPKTADLSTQKVQDAAEYVGFPALIKPNETTGARGFAVVHTIQNILAKLPDIQKIYGACHLQEFIPSGGNQYKVELFIYDLKLINSTVIHKIRFYPEKGGSSCFNQTIVRNDLVELCYNVLKKIEWVGFADFDLIEDPRDGIIKIMEINPRIPACIKASFNSGVDFVENIVHCTKGIPPQKHTYRPGSYLRYLGLDLLWFLNSRNRFRTKPSWFKGLLSPKQYLQDGSWDDLRPFLFGTIGGLLKHLNPIFRASKKGMN